MYKEWEPNYKNYKKDPTLTPSTSMVELWPKQLINQHDYNTMTQSKVQDTHDHDRLHKLMFCNRKADKDRSYASRQIQEEEQNILKST